MTLIVAAIEGSQVWMVSDTAVTDPKASLRDRTNLPKIFPIQGRSLVGFAGDVTYGLRVIKELSLIEPGQATLEALTRAHLEHQSVDFAYAYMQDSTPRLFKISEGVANSITASYLGQKTAFEVFQKIRNDMSIDHAPNAIHQFLSDDISDQCHEAIMAMLRFFSSTNEREVGGWALPYVLSSYGTKLCAYAYSVSDPIMNQLTTGIIIPHGTAEAGGFVLSVTELHEKDGVVVYWLQKPGGQVWVYSENDYEMKQFDGVPSAFKEEVKKTLGRDIDLWVSDEPIANTSLAATVQDQQGRPRVDIVKSGNKLSFSVAQSLSESFKGTAIVKNDVDDKETC